MQLDNTKQIIIYGFFCDFEIKLQAHITFLALNTYSTVNAIED